MSKNKSKNRTKRNKPIGKPFNGRSLSESMKAGLMAVAAMPGKKDKKKQ